MPPPPTSAKHPCVAKAISYTSYESEPETVQAAQPPARKHLKQSVLNFSVIVSTSDERLSSSVRTLDAGTSWSFDVDQASTHVHRVGSYIKAFWVMSLWLITFEIQRQAGGHQVAKLMLEPACSPQALILINLLYTSGR